MKFEDLKLQHFTQGFSLLYSSSTLPSFSTILFQVCVMQKLLSDTWHISIFNCFILFPSTRKTNSAWIRKGKVGRWHCDCYTLFLLLYCCCSGMFCCWCLPASRFSSSLATEIFAAWHQLHSKVSLFCRGREISQGLMSWQEIVLENDGEEAWGAWLKDHTIKSLCWLNALPPTLLPT